MVNESELISEIRGIARKSGSLVEAVDRIENLLAREVGAATLILRPVECGSPFLTGTGVTKFLESRDFPFRGLYTAPLVQGDHPRGVLVACFGTWDVPAEMLQRATVYTAAQLGSLLGRTASCQSGAA